MTLDKEVESNRKNIRSDSLTMSVGEAVNMYRDKEIIIRPEYQRLFRWGIEKQSRLLESILLAIPLPPIFVAQLEDGTWEIVDGLQRMSTILKFMGELRDEVNGGYITPEPLARTRYLPSLEGATWSGDDTKFNNALRINMKRARFDFQILLRESDEQVKFELFDRLNSGGAPTSAQEVRTAHLLMVARPFYQWLDALRHNADFVETLPLTSRLINEQYDLSLVVRFFSLAYSTSDRLRSFTDIDSFLTDRSLELAKDPEFDLSVAGGLFERTFRILSAAGPDAFRKYDDLRGRSVGAFSVSAYEATSIGVFKNLAAWSDVPRDDLPTLLQSGASRLWHDNRFLQYSGAGVRATQRVPVMGGVGERIFNPKRL